MPSITGWLRLEPLPRTDALQVALEARTADPLWYLARQWQIGEFAGEDAGSPVVAQLRAEVGRVSRFHAGPIEAGSDPSAGAIDIDDQSMPLEALVEREQVRAPGSNTRLAAEAGLHFGRLLDLNGESSHRATFLAAYPIDSTVDEGYDPDGSAAGRFYSGRVIDGAALGDELIAHLGSGEALASLPPAVSAAATAGTLAAANEYLRWWSASLHEPGDGQAPSWKANRLEYGFAVSAAMNAPPEGSGAAPAVTMVADEYRDGHLDWYSFRATTDLDLGSAVEPEAPRAVTRTVIPTQVTYRGQPSDRFWGFEDAKVSFGELSSAAGDVGRFLLAEYALRYGDDWFIVPIDMAVGSVAVVQSLTITDSFGVETDVPPATEAGGGRWRMFTTGDGESAYADSVFFLPPTELAPINGEPVEEVAMFRDEMANMVWGVERRIQGASGSAVDRYAEHQQSDRSLVGKRAIDGGVEDAEIVYRLASNVPQNWLPFVPVSLSGAGGSSAISLERRSMTHHRADGQTDLIQPRGQILANSASGDPLTLEEEEVPRGGVVVSRGYQLTRWTDGSRHAWMARKATDGTGEGSSGLRFDFTEQI